MIHKIPKKLFSNYLNVPTIDISSFQSANQLEKALAVKKLKFACENYGVFLITNHGLEGGKLLSSIKSFFSLPKDQKLAIKAKSSNPGFKKGYIDIGEESGSDFYEVKEAFSYGFTLPPLHVPVNPLQSHNIWPKKEVLPSFKEDCEEAFINFCNITKGLAQGLSLTLEREESFFHNKYLNEGHKISLMRLFHYLPNSQAPKEASSLKKTGSSEHTDWGFLTIIQQEDEIPGLQVFYQEKWWDIPARKDALVVNCGDYLSLLTENKYISPLHRVVNQERERVSAVFFFYPSYGAKMPALEGSQNYSLFQDQKKGGQIETKSEHFLKKTFGEYLLDKWEQVAREGKIY